MDLSFETDGGIGTRAVLGVIVLEEDETLENEFARYLALEGVALYHSRVPMVAQIRPDTLLQMEKDLPAAARLLPASPDYDVIGYGCTSAASVIGSDRVAQVIGQVFPGAAVTDPLASIIAACHSLQAKRLGFVSPYVPQVSQRMRERLEEAGLTITAFGSFNEGDDRVVARITPASITDAIRRIARSAPCDAIVVACTNLRTQGLIADAEQIAGVPVISSNQALAWHMRRLAGIFDAQAEFGALFQLP